MKLNRECTQLFNELVISVEQMFLCKGLSTLIRKLINNKLKLYYLNKCKTDNIIPFHLLHHTLFLEHKFNPQFLKSNKYNNNFFNNFCKRLISLDIQQSHWLENELNRKFLKITKHTSDPIKLIISLNAFTEIIGKCKPHFDKKIKRTYQVKNDNNYTTNSKHISTTIISNNFNNARITNFNYSHVQALNKYNLLYKDNLVVNLTDLHIPNNIINFLSLGPNFALPSPKINNKDIINLIADVEDIISSINSSDNHKNAIRNKSNNIMDNNLKANNHLLNIVEKQILRDKTDFQKWRKEISNDIVITNTDKTKQTIILSLDLYKSKMQDHLNNKTFYKTSRTVPLDNINDKVKSFNKKLLEQKLINTSQFKHLNINNPVCPRIYGLLKAHKTNIPIRPIVNSYDAPWYNLSKLLNPTLDHFNNKNNFDIKNAFDLINKLNDIQLDENDRLISLDVVSLFPNIPLEYFYRIIENNFENEIKPHSFIKNKNQYLQGLKLCLDNGYFTYDGDCYRQVSGVPMGGCMSVNVSGIVLNNIVLEAINKLPNKPKIITKYIDDLFLIVNKDEINITLNTFNSINTKIKFTLEIENNNNLNYLDLSIIRNMNNVKFKWFKKECASNRLLNFYSNHPYYIKTNTGSNLINRALNLTSPEFHTEMKKIIKKLLLDNMYPEHFINKQINAYTPTIFPKVEKPNIDQNQVPSNSYSAPQINLVDCTNKTENKKQRVITEFFKKPVTISPANPIVNDNIKVHDNNNPTNNNDNKSPNKTNLNTISNLGHTNNEIKKFKSIPFINPLSFKMKKMFKDYEVNDLKLVFKPINKMGRVIYTNTKDKIKKELNKDLIYQIDCNNCDKTYIGQTKQFLYKRVDQHRKNSSSKTETQNNKTSLSQHSVKFKHSFNFENAKILHKETNFKKRSLIESIYIAKNIKEVVNEKKDAGNINMFYANTIENLKNKQTNKNLT